MPTKTQHLQIRVTAREKAALKGLAERAGLDLSGYVLGRALPSLRLHFGEILQALGDEAAPPGASNRSGTSDRGGTAEPGDTADRHDAADRRFALAELNDFLTALVPAEFADAVADADIRALDSFTANYVAALVEQAAALNHVAPPPWAKMIPPLCEPYFAGGLKSLRPHLLREAPVPFKRRNIFVDSALGDRA